jgi:hypothetical protein
VSLTIDGGGGTLDGAGTYRGLFVYAGNLTVGSLTIADAKAEGSAGGKGQFGGYGGAGLIGGIEGFVLIADQLGLKGWFWNGVGTLNDNFNGLGFPIIGTFIFA